MIELHLSFPVCCVTQIISIIDITMYYTDILFGKTANVLGMASDNIILLIDCKFYPSQRHTKDI